MRSDDFFAELILLFLILIICFILMGGFYFICRAVFFKARHVPRRHLKEWVPVILGGMRPSASSEMILVESLDIGPNTFRIPAKESCPNSEDQYFKDRVSVTNIPDGNWDEAQIGLLSSFSSSEQGLPSHSRSSDSTETEVILRDESPPAIIPIVHNVV